MSFMDWEKVIINNVFLVNSSSFPYHAKGTNFYIDAVFTVENFSIGPIEERHCIPLIIPLKSLNFMKTTLNHSQVVKNPTFDLY